MKFLVVILNYRSTDLTIDCLRSIAPEVGRVPGFRVVVVENGTGGDAVPRLAEAIRSNGWGSWCALRAEPANLGFTGGNNVAIREALRSSDPPEFVLLLNSDTVVQPGAFGALVEHMERNPRAGIAGSLLLTMDGTPGPSPFRFLGLASELNRGLHVAAVRRTLGRWLDPPGPDAAGPVDWVSGASMMLRSAMLREVGLLDEAFFTYFEDIDLCRRAWNAGWEVTYVPESRVLHLEGGSSGVGGPGKRRPAFFHEARRRYFLKHFGALRTALIDAAYLGGATLRRVHAFAAGSATEETPHLLADSFRHSVFVAGFRLPEVRPPPPPDAEGEAAAGRPEARREGPPSPGASAPMTGLRKAAREALRALPLPLWQAAFPKDVVGLSYHVVSDADLAHHKLYPYKTAAQFEADVAWARPRALSYEEIVRRRLGGGKGPSNGIFFSFDDGYAECHDVVRPILRRHGVDAAFFVTTDFLDDRRIFAECSVSLCVERAERMSDEEARAAIDRLGLGTDLGAAFREASPTTRRRVELCRMGPGAGPLQWRLAMHALQFGDADDGPVDELCALLGVDAAEHARRSPIFMTREQVRALAADGFTVGAHSTRHLPLGSVGEDELERVVVESCALVRDLTGRKRVPFAFPYGAVGISRQVLARILRRHDFVEIFFDAEGLGRDEPFVVQRLWGDTPPAVPGGGSNLPVLIRQAWAQRAAWYRGGR